MSFRDLARQDSGEAPRAGRLGDEPEQHAGLRPPLGGEPFARLRSEVTSCDLRAGRGDVAYDQRRSRANLDAAEGRHGLEDEQGAAWVSKGLAMVSLQEQL